MSASALKLNFSCFDNDSSFSLNISSSQISSNGFYLSYMITFIVFSLTEYTESSSHIMSCGNKVFEKLSLLMNSPSIGIKSIIASLTLHFGSSACDSSAGTIASSSYSSPITSARTFKFSISDTRTSVTVSAKRILIIGRIESTECSLPIMGQS